MKKPLSVACLAFAIALTASPVAQSATPARGAWNGRETRHWAGGKWEAYSYLVPVSFRLARGAAAHFTTGGTYTWPGCTGGETVSAKLPATRRARVRHGAFRGRRTTYVGARKMTTRVSGRFVTARRARGQIVVKLAGCPTYRSVWNATRPKRARRQAGGGDIHIPFCRGQNVQMPDGTYYYNSCAYVAGH